MTSTLDDARKLDLLRGELVDQAGHFATQTAQRLRHPIAGGNERVSLAGQLLDQRTDPALVVLVRALECRYFVVHERFELTGAAERATDGVVHERDLASNGLTQRCDRLLRHAVGFRKTYRNLGHRS